MGERLLCKQEVDGSIPFTSTRLGIELGAQIGRRRAVSCCSRWGIRTWAVFAAWERIL